ncbi:MAG: hypothetical protein ACKO2P_12195, partial [Planctomycetota bacterium]
MRAFFGTARFLSPVFPPAPIKATTMTPDTATLAPPKHAAPRTQATAEPSASQRQPFAIHFGDEPSSNA